MAADPRFFRQAQQLADITFRSLMVAPLTVHDRLVGVALVLNPRGGGRFTPEDLELFATYCHQVAVAVENARLHKADLERERETQQLELAAMVQQSFLPSHVPAGDGRRFVLEAKTLPAAAVAGDLYDFVEIPGDRLMILIGDVSGKGFPAALMMAKVVSDFRAAAHRIVSPAAILSGLNVDLAGHSPRGMFVTAACLALDAERGHVEYANAGHLPFLWHRVGRGVVDELFLDPGDTMLFYTDGVVEARGAGEAPFGLDRLAEVMRERLPSTGNLVSDLLEAVLVHTGEKAPNDDVTLLALRWRPRFLALHT